MKKIIILLLGLFLLTGCSKNITCTKEVTEEGVKNTTKVTTKYNNKEIKKLELMLSMELIDEKTKNKTEFETLTSTLKSFYDNYEEEGITVEETKEAKKYSLDINYKKNKITNLKRILNVDLISGEKLKRSLEKDGYICK